MFIPHKYRLDADSTVARLRGELATLPDRDVLRRRFVDAEAALQRAEIRARDLERASSPTLDDVVAAQHEVDQAQDTLGAAQRQLRQADRQRVAVTAALTKAEDEAKARIAADVAREMRKKLNDLDKAIGAAAAVQEELNALHAAADQFAEATLHGFAYNRAFPQGKYGQLLFTTAAFSKILSTERLTEWRKALTE